MAMPLSYAFFCARLTVKRFHVTCYLYNSSLFDPVLKKDTNIASTAAPLLLLK